VAFGDATAYASVAAGTYNIQLRPAGADPASAPVFETGDLTLMEGSRSTALAAGLFGSTDAADLFRILPLAENFGTAASGNARVRVVHAGADAPTVDIDVGDDGTSEIMDLARFADTGETGVDLPAGTAIKLAIIAGGTKVTTFTTPNLADGVEYFVIATGLLSGTPVFRLLAIDETSAEGTILPDPVTGLATIRAVHSSPDAPAVDIYAEGIPTPLFSNLAYTETTEYAPVPEGTYNIQIRAAGADPSSLPVYETGDVVINAGDRITAIAAGFLLSTDPLNSFRVLGLGEEAGTIEANALVRIVHAGPDAPVVDIDVGDDGSVEIGGLARFADTGPTWAELPADAALQIAIRVTGGDRVTAFTTPELTAGEELFVIATGSLAALPREDAGFGLLVVGPSGTVGLLRQNPTVYALHGSPDTPAVDIYAGDALLASNLSFGDLSAPIQVPPAAYQLDFFPTGAGNGGTPAASATTPELMVGQRYLAVAGGELSPEGSQGGFRLIPVDDAFPTELDTNPRIRAVHASGDAPAVDIGTVDAGAIDAVLFPNLAFGEASDGAGVAVSPGLVTLGIAPTGSPTPVATFDVTPTLDARIFAVAIGALAPDASEEGIVIALVVLDNQNPWIVGVVQPN